MINLNSLDELHTFINDLAIDNKPLIGEVSFPFNVGKSVEVFCLPSLDNEEVALLFDTMESQRILSFAFDASKATKGYCLRLKCDDALIDINCFSYLRL